MQRSEVISSNIKSVGYRDTILEIEFNNNMIYKYNNVPIDICKALLQASSVGKYFNAHIRNKYIGEMINE